jgi:transmembrane sensor
VVFEAPGYRQEVLADGTIVDLNRGAHLFVQFGAVERRVLLVQGEAQFTVAKDAARPFVVRAGGVDLRAVGTTFNVKLAGASIEVLVTEGTVQVAQREMAASPVAGESGAPSASPALLAELRAGQRTVIAVAPVFVPPVVERASPQEIARLLEWTPYLLDFDSTPLVEVVATFNRTSATRLVIADEALRELPIVASIRFDNVEGFVRLLEATMGVRAERRASGEIALHRAR